MRSIEREALRLALENGPAALTVDQICEAVGISQRNFFNHFDTKDDALLGWELPHLSEERCRLYIEDDSIGVLTGALTLVELPNEFMEDMQLFQARLRVIAAAPWLMTRQIARMLPVTAMVAGVVEQKLRRIAGPDIDDDRITSAAALITSMGAALVLRPPNIGDMMPGDDHVLPPDMPTIPMPNPAAASSGLEDMRWIWDRLI